MSRNPGSVFDKFEVSHSLFFLVEGGGLRVSPFYAKGSGIFVLVVFCHFFQLLLVVQL